LPFHCHCRSARDLLLEVASLEGVGRVGWITKAFRGLADTIVAMAWLLVRTFLGCWDTGDLGLSCICFTIALLRLPGRRTLSLSMACLSRFIRSFGACFLDEVAGERFADFVFFISL